MRAAQPNSQSGAAAPFGRVPKSDNRGSGMGLGLEELETSDNPGRVIARVLAEARQRMDMDVAFVSEFTRGRRVFRFVDGDVESVGLEVDGSDPLEDAYCARVVDGRIPCLIPDAQEEPGVADLAATKALGVGAHVSVPIVFESGRVYGTFCCFSQNADHSLTEADVQAMRAMAGLVAESLEVEELEAESHRAAARRIDAILRAGGPTMVFQPIVDLVTSMPVGVEALARFEVEPRRTPDVWFDEAWSTGRGVELELAAARSAARRLDEIPQHMYLSINVSPETALSPALLQFLEEREAERIVLEITEHAHIEDYPIVRRAIQAVRERGTRIAVDDVGTGYAGLQQLLELRPDVLKLDLSITRGVDTDPIRHSLAQSVASFSTAAGLSVVAEGIETESEAKTLQRLGIRFGQGYHLGRPGPLNLGHSPQG